MSIYVPEKQCLWYLMSVNNFLGEIREIPVSVLIFYSFSNYSLDF